MLEAGKRQAERRASRLQAASCAAGEVRSCGDVVRCKQFEKLSNNSSARAPGAEFARAHRQWAGSVRTQSWLLTPALSLPGFLLSCGARLVAASGRSAVKRDPVSAPCHVLRSLRHVSESRALGAPAPGLQQHHSDMQWQHPADQSSQ